MPRSVLPVAIVALLVQCTSSSPTSNPSSDRPDEPSPSQAAAQSPSARIEGTLPRGSLTASVQGVRVSWPPDWTLVQLAGETPTVPGPRSS